MPRVAANLGLHETNYEALTDMLQADGIQSDGINLDPHDTHYCQRRLRKYSWWHHGKAAERRYGEKALTDPGVVQETLAKTCALARDLCKQVRYGIELTHFLYAWDSPEVRTEHATVKAKMEKERDAREAKVQQGEGELDDEDPEAKRRRGNGGGSILNSGVVRKTTKKDKEKGNPDDWCDGVL